MYISGHASAAEIIDGISSNGEQQHSEASALLFNPANDYANDHVSHARRWQQSGKYQGDIVLKPNNVIYVVGFSN